MPASLSLSTETDQTGFCREQASFEACSTDSYSLFLLAIRSPVTKEKYLQRMGYFLDFLNIPKADDSGKTISMEHRLNKFSKIALEDNVRLTNNIIKYLQLHKKRVERKEITGSTLRNYIKPIKLFCEQMDIEIPWKKIIRGMPKRHF